MHMIRFYLLTVTLLLIFIPQTSWAENAPPTGVDTYDHITVSIHRDWLREDCKRRVLGGPRPGFSL